MSEILYGRNAVRESLRARRRHAHRLLLADNLDSSALINELSALAQEINIPIERVARKKLAAIAPGHQGVALKVGRYPLVSVDDLLSRANKLNQSPFFLILDHLEDPHNLGAILRTAEIVGVQGVILPKQRAASITPAVVNVSAGAAEHIWTAEVPNLVRVMKDLKKANVWVVGVEDSPTAQPFHQANLTGAIALVIGNEGQGLSRLVGETCDFLIKIPMRGRLDSLNASVAGGLALYEVWRQQGFTI